LQYLPELYTNHTKSERWDYGYQTTAMANRTIIVDNNTWNTSHIATVGRAMASPEAKAWRIFRWGLSGVGAGWQGAGLFGGGGIGVSGGAGLGFDGWGSWGLRWRGLGGAHLRLRSSGRAGER
jgi:hypothetical protein